MSGMTPAYREQHERELAEAKQGLRRMFEEAGCLPPPDPPPTDAPAPAAGDRGLTVAIEGQALIVRLPIAALPHVVEAAPWNHEVYVGDEYRPSVTVRDAATFAADVLQELQREEEDGTTMVHLMLDRAMEAALDNGTEGLEVREDDPE